jgi:ubiquitin-protein ligase
MKKQKMRLIQNSILILFLFFCNNIYSQKFLRVDLNFNENYPFSHNGGYSIFIASESKYPYKPYYTPAESFEYIVIREKNVIETGKVNSSIIPSSLQKRLQKNDVIIYYNITAKGYSIPSQYSLRITVPAVK